MIDLKARERIISERQTARLADTVVSKLGKTIIDKEDPTVGPIQQIEQEVVQQTKIGKFSLGFLRDIYTHFLEVTKLTPTKEEVADVALAVRALKFPQPLDTVSVNPDQIQHLVDVFRDIKFPDIPTSVTVKNQAEVVKAIEQLQKTVKALDKTQEITGNVTINNPTPPPDLSSIVKAVKGLQEIHLLMKKEPKVVEKPQDSGINEQFREDLVTMFEGIRVALERIYNKEIDYPTAIDIRNFPPTMVSTPVTNININALQGFIETTFATVGTSVVRLPDYGQLFNRRALLIYNNSANTIYIGGSEVTVSNGLPIPAYSYSPPIDAGYNLHVYGVAAQGGNNVRVLEVSKDQTANVQQ